jgi:CRISPR-associated endonuclease/helicase Cas3
MQELSTNPSHFSVSKTFPWSGALARPGQSLAEHSANVSELASRFGAKFGAPKLLSVCGFLHDLGKVKPDFQRYLSDESAVRGSVQHSGHGAKAAYELAAAFPAAGEIMGNSIAAHHGSLYDSLAADGATPLIERLNNVEMISVESVTDADIGGIKAEINAILAKSLPQERAFTLSMLTKMVYSALVDADRLDAYLFENQENFIPNEPDWGAFLIKLEQRLASFDSSTAMAALRRRVSDDCAEAGSRSLGIYKLEVPTGGGKTLASLRFALEHARRHGLDRIIYVIPYLSILNQTAKEIRLALDADEKTVLEHHSGFLSDDDPQTHKLHTDRWDAPIVLTTQVQFLESVFSAKGGDLRKLHNMSRSVFIFDEAQSLPVKCVHLFNSAANFLSRVCSSTILLCTATHPLLDEVERPIGFAANPSIAECGSPQERTRIVNALRAKGYGYDELAAFVMEKHTLSTLVIVNTKNAAKSLYEELKALGAPVVHLSTNMCAAHRDSVIAELRRRLDKKEPVICVSTQLIEAGVVISLECVIRELAGLDSIFQAAGRCNRHGEFGQIKNVYVVNIASQNLSKLPDIKIGAEISQKLFDEANLDMDEYYRHYFHSRRSIMDYPTRDNAATVYDLLTINITGRKAYEVRADKQGVKPPTLPMAIRSAAEEFYVIDRGRTEVVVPYRDSEELLARYIETDNLAVKRGLLRELGKYSVSLYQYQCDELSKHGALSDNEGVIALARGFYDEERGLDLEGSHEFLIL